MKQMSQWIRAGIALGVILLMYIALERGTAELTALATALAAGAALVASAANKGK
jgi:hypothetical protein